jgi:hypothetical protein
VSGHGTSECGAVARGKGHPSATRIVHRRRINIA